MHHPFTVAQRRVDGHVRVGAGRRAGLRVRHRLQRQRDRRRLDPYPPRRRAAAGLRPARHHARGGQRQVRLPARGVQVRPAAARRHRVRLGPGLHAAGRRRLDPRGHRVPEDARRLRPAHRRADADHRPAAQGGGRRRQAGPGGAARHGRGGGTGRARPREAARRRGQRAPRRRGVPAGRGRGGCARWWARTTARPGTVAGVRWERLDVRDRRRGRRVSWSAGAADAVVVNAAYRVRRLGGHRRRRGPRRARRRRGRRPPGALSPATRSTADGPSPTATPSRRRRSPAYGAAKAAAETAVRGARPGAALVRTLADPRRRQQQVRRRCAARRSRPGGPLHRRDPLPGRGRADLAAAVLELVGTDRGRRVLNVAGPEAVSRAELGRLVAARYGLDGSRIRAGSVAAAGLSARSGSSSTCPGRAPCCGPGCGRPARSTCRVHNFYA